MVFSFRLIVFDSSTSLFLTSLDCMLCGLFWIRPEIGSDINHKKLLLYNKEGVFWHDVFDYILIHDASSNIPLDILYKRGKQESALNL